MTDSNLESLDATVCKDSCSHKRVDPSKEVSRLLLSTFCGPQQQHSYTCLNFHPQIQFKKASFLPFLGLGKGTEKIHVLDRSKKSLTF